MDTQLCPLVQGLPGCSQGVSQAVVSSPGSTGEGSVSKLLGLLAESSPRQSVGCEPHFLAG